MTYFHACGEIVVDRTKGTRRMPDPYRDENIVQEIPGGEVTMKAVGLGRALLSQDDLLTGATPDRVTEILAMPAQEPVPWPEDPPHPRHGRVMPERPNR